jgi:hypothetical protein
VTKQILLPVTSILLLSLAVSRSIAQINPVRLSVTKNRKVNQKTTQQNTGIIQSWSEHEVKETVSYTIEVANATTAPVPNLRIHWAILVKPVGNAPLEFIEGEKTCSLALGGKYVFDTDVLELGGKKWQTSDGQYRQDDSSKVLGCAVEAFIGNQRVAADVQPADTKRKIDELKTQKEKSPRRQF